MKLSSWRAALRIARRDALRAKGRSALVVAMIALPVLGVAGADVVFRSTGLEPGERAVRLLGQSDALLTSYGRGMTVMQPPIAGEGGSASMPKDGEKPTPEQQKSLQTDPGVLALELLPKGSVLTPVLTGHDTTAGSRDGRLRTRTAEADLTDPIWHGKLDIVQGRAPGAPQELAATRAFLDQAGLEVGSTTTVRGLEDRPYTITAAVEDPGSLDTVELIGRPGALIEPQDKALGQVPRGGRGGVSGGGSWLVKLPAGAVLDWPKVLELNKYGLVATSRTVVLDPPPRSQVPYYVDQDRRGGAGSGVDRTAVIMLATVAGMALLEIVLLAGPAFAVGARRSRRQLGLLAAGGGDRSHVRAVVLGGGAVLGLAGAAAGVVSAILLTAATRPWLEETAGRRFGHLDLRPLDLLGIAALGLVTGLLAAVVPAVQASRQNVVEALTGRGALRPPSRRPALLGLLMLAGGAALALLGAVGGQGTLAVLGGSV
ncbi:FtsX-like permease family protein, partial [Kitasatospora sp. NPDC056138]|uniref:FtsX-like permease family protein n=1 Tax=Kitasatospora sp. NPDC056138 TaxID=3345724 RepID=UPI0035E299F0